MKKILFAVLITSLVISFQSCTLFSKKKETTFTAEFFGSQSIVISKSFVLTKVFITKLAGDSLIHESLNLIVGAGTYNGYQNYVTLHGSLPLVLQQSFFDEFYVPINEKFFGSITTVDLDIIELGKIDSIGAPILTAEYTGRALILGNGKPTNFNIAYVQIRGEQLKVAVPSKIIRKDSTIAFRNSKNHGIYGIEENTQQAKYFPEAELVNLP